jgi:hypothetical protein
MRKILIPFICTFLAGCSSVYQPIPTVSYNVPTTIHVNKPASVIWKSGAMTTQDGRTATASIETSAFLFGPLAMLSAPDMQNKENLKNAIYFGPKDQAIFMRSLRNYLDENNIFKKTELNTAKSNDPKNVYITVTFKSTRVGESNSNYPVTLDTVLTIQYHKQLFKRHYFIHEQGKKPDSFNGNDFVYHSTKAAQRLLRDTAKGVITWAKQFNKTRGKRA